jgi:hypothetical protein
LLRFVRGDCVPAPPPKDQAIPFRAKATLRADDEPPRRNRRAVSRSPLMLKTAANPVGLPQGVIWNWWRHGMMGGAKAHCDGIVAFSHTDSTEDLKKISVAVLVIHGDDDQIAPYAGSAPLSAKLLSNSTLKTYKGFPHGMPTTEADAINALTCCLASGRDAVATRAFECAPQLRPLRCCSPPGGIWRPARAVERLKWTCQAAARRPSRRSPPSALKAASASSRRPCARRSVSAKRGSSRRGASQGSWSNGSTTV